MKYTINVFSIYEYGQRKDADGNPHQEDCTYPAVGDLSDADRTFVLCDGMGGHEAGEVASATVCQAIGGYLKEHAGDVFTDVDFNKALEAAYDALDQKDSGSGKKMGTTMTFLKLHEAGATIAHIGDSRVYHIRPGKDGGDTEILFATEDHSLVNDLIKVGELTREQARKSPQKNVITRAMQPNVEMRPKADIHHITDIKAGDYFYMCSDGMLEQEEMENGESIRNLFSRAVKEDSDKVRILRSVTENNKDNHTALIIHILSVEEAPERVVGKATLPPSIGEGIVEEGTAIPASASKSKTKDVAAAAATSDKTKPGGGQPSNIKGHRRSRPLLPAIVAALCVVAVFIGVSHMAKCTGSDKVEVEEIKTTSPEENLQQHKWQDRKSKHTGSGSSAPDSHQPATPQRPHSSAPQKPDEQTPAPTPRREAPARKETTNPGETKPADKTSDVDNIHVPAKGPEVAPQQRHTEPDTPEEQMGSK